MSATRRLSKRKSYDNYPTPSWVTKAILNRLKPTGYILDPCIGEGAIVSAGQHELRAWCGVEIREEAYGLLDLMYREGKLAGFVIRDFFDDKTLFPVPFPDVFDWVITNPPYSLAEKMIKRSLQFSPLAVHLLRLNFLEGQKRSEWMSRHVPDVFVLPRRPNFLKGQVDPVTGKPYGGDSCGYAWMMFFRHERTVGNIEILKVND